MNDLLLNMLCGIVGSLTGISIGLGFWPKYKQPKNLQIQTVFFILAIIGMVIIIYCI